MQEGLAKNPTGEDQHAFDILDMLSNIPDGVWEALAVALFAAIGWFSKSLFDWWRKSRLPFEQDQIRYKAVLNCVNITNLYYLKNTALNSIVSTALDGIEDSVEALIQINQSTANYLHKKLNEYEKELLETLTDLNAYLPLKFFPTKANGNVFTMYWDTFDEWNEDHQKRAADIQNEIFSKVDKAISDFEKYQDYGNKLFANRLVKEKADG